MHWSRFLFESGNVSWALRFWFNAGICSFEVAAIVLMQSFWRVSTASEKSTIDTLDNGSQRTSLSSVHEQALLVIERRVCACGLPVWVTLQISQSTASFWKMMRRVVCGAGIEEYLLLQQHLYWNPYHYPYRKEGKATVVQEVGSD